MTVLGIPGYRKFEPLYHTSMLCLADERDNNESGEISQTAGASPHWWKGKTAFLGLILNNELVLLKNLFWLFICLLHRALHAERRRLYTELLLQMTRNFNFL